MLQTVATLDLEFRPWVLTGSASLDHGLGAQWSVVASLDLCPKLSGQWSPVKNLRPTVQTVPVATGGQVLSWGWSSKLALPVGVQV